MLKDSRSYEVQIIDAVRSVNRALGGTYGTSSAIHKSDFNQYEVQLIDAIKGIGRTLSGKGLSLAGGGIADTSGFAAQLQDLSRRVTTLENESFFRLVDGNVTLKSQYRNLWVPGWLAAGGVGTGGGGGGSVEHLSDIGDVSISNLTDGQGIVWDATNNVWKNATVGGGGGSGTVTGVKMNGTTYSPTNGIVNLGTVITSLSGYATQTWVQQRGYLTTETDPTVPSWAKQTNPGLYVGTTQVQTSSAAQALTGILSVKNSTNNSLFEWDGDNNAWHFYGNLYADGWVAAGGIGSSSSGGVTNLSQLDDVSLSSPSNNQFLYYDNGYWKNTALKTINNISIIGSGNISISGGGGGGISSVSLAPGTNNGTLKLTVDSSVTDNIAVQGLGALAYKSSLLANDIPDLSGTYVTLATEQNDISGAKTFTTKTNFTGGLAVPQTAYIDLGPVRIKFENNALHITKVDPNDNNNYGIYADGFVSAGGVDQNS